MLSSAVVIAAVLSVYDGDTFTADVQGQVMKIRVLGVDTPEIRGKCAGEILGAVKARDRASELMGDKVTLHIGEPDRYGRKLAYVQLPDGTDLAERLIAEGLGREYWGGYRKPWCY